MPNEDPIVWTIDELITRYTYEPYIADVFTEGWWDATVIRRAFKESGCGDAVPYDINVVSIERSIVEKYCTRVGNKSRVVALAHELAAKLNPDSKVSCVADADCDRALGISYTSPILQLTDYSCLESYIINDGVIDKFLDMVVRSCPLDASQLLQLLHGPLAFLFAVRAAKEYLNWPMAMPRLKKYIRVSSDNISINEDGYVNALLNSGQKITEKQRFVERVSEIRKLLPKDIRHIVHKDDVFGVLAEYLSQFDKGAGLGKSDFVARSIAGCIDIGQLLKEPMIQSLIARVA